MNVSVVFILGLHLYSCGLLIWFNRQNDSPLSSIYLTFLRELIKDMADVKGDKTLGLSTYPVVAGRENQP